MTETAAAVDDDAVETGTGPLWAVVWLLLYVVATYLAAAIIPYLWSPRPYPPTWMWIVPGWLLGVPGFFVTMLGPILAIPVALTAWGLLVPVLWRHRLSAPLRVCAIAAVVLTTAYAVFTCTPLAATIQTFVAD